MTLFRLPTALACLTLLMTGCASNSVFVPYPAKAAAWQQSLQNGALSPEAQQLGKISRGKDALLARLEQGRWQQLQGQYADSKSAFDDAIRQFQAIDDRATISLGHTAQQGESLVTNDNVIAYQGALYERVFLHEFQAMNYLALGDREGAMVEMRRARDLQDRKTDAPTAPDSGTTLSDDALGEYNKRLAAQDELANRIASSTRNAYALWLSGLMFESARQNDDAFIDYKQALAIAPGNPVLQQDVQRLALALGRPDEARALPLKGKPTPPKANEGTLAVLFEEGFVPPRKEIFLPFPWPESWYVLAFPYYDSPWVSPPPLRIAGANLKAPVDTALATDVQALAARALKDQRAAMLIRQTLRAQAKHKMQQEANDKGGALLGVLVGAYNVLSENADLRSWLTLPRSAQIARLTLPEGAQTLTLDNTQTVTVNIQRNRATLLRVVKIDNRYYTASWPL